LVGWLISWLVEWVVGQISIHLKQSKNPENTESIFLRNARTFNLCTVQKTRTWLYYEQHPPNNAEHLHEPNICHYQD